MKIKRTYRAFRSTVVVVAVLGLSAVPVRVAAAVTTPVNCGTQNLQTAINNAAAGDTLAISGTCVGVGAGSAFTINAKSLTLAGSPHATLQPSGSARVLLINGPANVALSDLTIVGGHAPSGDGGGIDNLATLVVSRTTVRANTAPGGYGGGIANANSLTLTHSTVSGNSASAGSGAVDNLGTLVVTDSTLFGNSVTAGNGGAVYNGAGTAGFTNSTIVNNSASGDGGGIFNGATMNLAGTIVAGNTWFGAPGTRDCFFPGAGTHMSSGGYNFIGQCLGYVPASTDLVGEPSAPMAGFGDYGGPTQSAPPAAGSALIDAIPTGSCFLSFAPDDQRGVRRPQGAACDIGAVEAAPPPVALNDSYSTPENTALSVGSFTGVLQNDSTTTGGSLSASIVSSPAHGSLTLGSDGSFTYTPALGYTGPDSFTYKATDAFTNESANAVANILVTFPPTRAVFPAMSNGAYGGYVTAATIQNIGSAAADIVIQYFNQNGSPVGIGDTITALPVNASRTVRQDNGNSFPSSGGDAAQAGSAVVYSSQPLASFVNEFAPGNVGDATSYSGVQVPSGVGPALYAPTIVNNAYGGYTTGIGLLNQGSSSTSVTIIYRDGSGAVIQTQTVSSLAAHAYKALYSGDATLALPSGFAGTATIMSSGQPLGAVVNETGPGGQFSSYDAVPAGSAMLNVPVALNNAFGGYYTGMGIQNTISFPGSVSITYYDASGTATVKNFTIPANGSLGVYQGSGTDGPAVGAYTAVIQSSLPLAAIVNEVAPSNTSAKQSTSYNTFTSGSSVLHLPLVENAGSDLWNTGEGIMNTGSSSTTVTVNYYDAATGTAVGAAQTLVLAPHAFWGLYQPTGGLTSGARATAVITTSSGGQVAVICNESSPTTFMSYDGQ